jgi:hypothetical protein
VQSQKFLDDMSVGPGPWVAPPPAQIYIPYLHSTQYESSMFDPAGVPGYWYSNPYLPQDSSKSSAAYFISLEDQDLLSRHPCQKRRIRRNKFDPSAHGENRARKQIPKGSRGARRAVLCPWPHAQVLLCTVKGKYGGSRGFDLISGLDSQEPSPTSRFALSLSSLPSTATAGALPGTQ